MSINAYPKPVITFVEVLDLLYIFNFLPVVTEMAKVAASLSLPNILPEEVCMDKEDIASLSPSIEGLENLSAARNLLSLLVPKSIFFKVVVWDGNLGLNSLSQKQVV